MSKRSSKPASAVPPEAAEAAEARAICAAHGNRASELLEILHDVQGRLGFVPEEVLPAIALALNLSRAEVHGVVTFYHDFRRAPAGRHVVKVCRAESCQAVDGRRLCAHAEERLGTPMGETSPDGRTTLEQVFCLGNCALSPAIMVDGKLYGRVTPERFDRIIAGLDKEAAE
jgi:formate dehydrogenase subunit gamma